MIKKTLFFYYQLLIIGFCTPNTQASNLSKIGQTEIYNIDEAQFWIQKLKNPDNLLGTSQEIQEQYRLNMLANFMDFKPMLKIELIEKIDFIQNYTKKNPIYDSAKQIVRSKDIKTWQNYLNNIYPIPSRDKVEKIRRKWYKKNKEPSFDIEFKESEKSE